MSRAPLICLILIATGVVLTTLPTATAQRRTYGGRLNTQQLVRRIDDLERRVADLEANLPVKKRTESTTMTVEQADRQLQIAQERHAFSERLFRKGYISQTEFETDRYEFQRAGKALELAKSLRDNTPTDEIRSSIQILDAQHYLAEAQAQLQLVERFVPGGFTGPSGLEGYRQAVAEAQLRLDRAEAAETAQGEGDNTPVEPADSQQER